MKLKFYVGNVTTFLKLSSGDDWGYGYGNSGGFDDGNGWGDGDGYGHGYDGGFGCGNGYGYYKTKGRQLVDNAGT